MCLVASGAADAYYHMGIHCWDMAGGAAVVTEAGGVIMDISGESQRKAKTVARPLVEMEVRDGANRSVSHGDCLTEQSGVTQMLFFEH